MYQQLHREEKKNQVKKKTLVYKLAIFSIVCKIMNINRTYTHENIPGSPGIWFPVLKDLIEYHSKMTSTAGIVCIAWDKNNTGSKAFGIFENAHDYFETVERMPPAKKSGYEIILRDSPCRLYLDVEWETFGSVDVDADAKVQSICESISKTIKSQYSRTIQYDVDFYISTCSRMKNDTVFKNSFHIIARNIIFPNNHNGEMEHFVRELNFENEIDLAVYTPNRCVRTEKCSKFGQNSFFRNVCSVQQSERNDSLITSLITVFDTTLPLLPNRNLFSKIDKKRKFINPIDVSNQVKKHFACSEIARNIFEMPPYFLDLFDNKITTDFQLKEIQDINPSNFPYSVQQLLINKNVNLSDVKFIYVKHPKCCVNKLLCGIQHAHHSNNSCAVAINVNGKIDIYTKCYGCGNQSLSHFHVFDNNCLLPSLPKNPVFHRIIHTSFGIDSVKDSMDRRRVLQIYRQKTKGEVNELLKNNSPAAYSKSFAYLWHKYITSAAFGWLIISEKTPI